MPRKPIVRSNHHYYHLAGRANNKEVIPLPLSEVWQIEISELKKLQSEFDFKIGAFVLMNNHFHLLALTPKEDIDRIMYFFMRRLTLRIQKRSGRINRIFGGRYKGSIIESERYFYNVYKYIYRNPIAAGIVERAEDYDFSTINGVRSLRVEPLFPSSELLKYINNSFTEVEALSIKQGLKKVVFEYSKDRSTGRPIVPTTFSPSYHATLT
jgi:putative transposase